MEEEFNPYAAPQTDARPENPHARAVRLEHLRVESHVKALGMLIMLGGVLTLLAVYMQARIIEREFPELAQPLQWTSALPIVPLIAGVGLCRLQRWGWILAVLFYGVSTIMSLYWAADMVRVLDVVALLIGVAILMFLLAVKTRKVFAASYAGIVAATPDLRSTVATWGWMIVLLGAVLFLFFALSL